MQKASLNILNLEAGELQQQVLLPSSKNKKLRLATWTWHWVNCTLMASTVTRSYQNIIKSEKKNKNKKCIFLFFGIRAKTTVSQSGEKRELVCEEKWIKGCMKLGSSHQIQRALRSPWLCPVQIVAQFSGEWSHRGDPWEPKCRGEGWRDGWRELSICHISYRLLAYIKTKPTSGSTTRPNMNPNRIRFRPYIHLRKMK